LAEMDVLSALQANLNQALIGKPETVKLLLVGLLSEGHVLLEDVPGVGKTTLAKALARSIDGSFRRIQFTPDLLPSDILGVSVYRPETGAFVFNRGPLFANVILADEINRATPRTQSAMLEAMNESQVSVDGQTLALPVPFMVIATQNPYEYHGTYALPESQLDRFSMRLRIGYPDEPDERQVLLTHREGEPVDALRPVTSAEDVRRLQAAVRRVRIDESLVNYVLAIGRATRGFEGIDVGVSPRGCLTLYRTAQALALIEGRDYCIPDDVKALASPVLSHRLIHHLGRPNSQDGRDPIREVVATIPVPT